LSSRTPDQSLHDILKSILMIEQFVAGVSFDQFQEEPVRRQLLLSVNDNYISL
jgi:uncharacterized protein with HEPN domain